MATSTRQFKARFALPPKEEDGDEGYSALVPREGPMDEASFGALVDAQINYAKNYESSDLIRRREQALQFYEGKVDIAAPPGRSSMVSRDLSDVHGLILPGIMRVFLATDNIAVYNPQTVEDEAFAQQATDYINYVLMRECDGYVHLRSAFHDGLLMGNGVVKHWWDETPEYSTESFSALTDDEYTMLAADPDVEEVIEHTEYDDPDWVPPPPQLVAPPLPGLLGGPPGMGMNGPNMGNPGMPPATAVPMSLGGMPSLPPELLQPPKLHDCKLKRCTRRGRLRFMAMAPEDFLVGRGTVILDEKDDRFRFCAHRWQRTRSTLIEMGYDPDIVADLPAAAAVNLDTPEKLARDEQGLYEGDMPPDKSTDLVDGFECYVRCDYDGDGVAEWRKGDVAGIDAKRVVLCNEEWGDDIPFSDLVPDPMPHRWRGRSLFDTMYDIQRVKSVVLRQGLDNTYFVNNPRQIVTENGIVNPEVLDDWEIGSTVIERSPNSVRWEQTPFVADKAFLALEYFDQVTEKRTGGAGRAASLDPEALSDQTATAVNAAQTQSYTKIEEYARNFAEYGGLRRIFSKILKLIVKHQDRPRTIRLRDQWVNVDPRAWNANMDVTINTGLGSGSRERDLAMLSQIATKQEQLILNLGVVNPVCGIDKLMETYRLAVEAAGIKPSNRFFPPVSQQTMQMLQQQMSQKVDPKEAAAKLQANIDMMKAEHKRQLDQQSADNEARMKQTELMFQQQQERAKAEHDAMLSAAASERDARMEEMRLERQAQIDQRKAQMDAFNQNQDLLHKQRLAEVDFQFKKYLKLMDAKIEHDKAEKQHQRDLTKIHLDHSRKMDQAEHSHELDMTAAKEAVAS